MDIITIEGRELKSLVRTLSALHIDTAHTLRINLRVDGCAIKVDERDWSPTIGSRTSDLPDALAALLDIREHCLSLARAYTIANSPSSFAAQEYTELAKLLEGIYAALGGSK